MNFPILRDDATRIFLRRAAIMWVLARLVFVAIGLARRDLGAAAPQPVGVILLAAFLSVAEWRGRNEGAFWRNLGVSLTRMVTVALGTALVCELLLYFGLRYVISHG